MIGHSVNATEDGLGVTFVLNWTTNPLPANGQRGGFYAHARKVKAVRGITAGLGQSHVLPGRRRLQLERAEVRLTWYVTTKRRRDADNLVPLMKALVDGLVTAGVIPDDNDDVLLRHMPRIVHEPAGTARFELTIRPTEGDPQ